MQIAISKTGIKKYFKFNCSFCPFNAVNSYVDDDDEYEEFCDFAVKGIPYNMKPLSPAWCPLKKRNQKKHD